MEQLQQLLGTKNSNLENSTIHDGKSRNLLSISSTDLARLVIHARDEVRRTRNRPIYAEVSKRSYAGVSMIYDGGLFYAFLPLCMKAAFCL
jgi:hypothetical protein